MQKDGTSDVGPFPPKQVKVKMCVECTPSIMVISFGGRVSLIHHTDVFGRPCGSAALSEPEVINNAK